MKVESQAGKFILRFDKMQPGQREVVITGKMGVWDATTRVSLPEFFALLRMTLHWRMIGFLVKALFLGAFFRRAPDGDGAA